MWVYCYAFTFCFVCDLIPFPYFLPSFPFIYLFLNLVLFRTNSVDFIFPVVLMH